MNFEWKMEKGKELSFEDRVHNLACFEIVLNILRMKSRNNDNIDDEIRALCGFALECMFGEKDLEKDGLFESIMILKDKNVNNFRASALGQIDIPKEMVGAKEIGEA